MNIFAYEFITGGGMRQCSEASPSGSLLNEGRAMISRLAEDLATADQVDQVTCLWDNRLPPNPSIQNCQWLPVDSNQQHDQAVKEQAAVADWTIIIAPEFDGHLERIAKLTRKNGGKLLGSHTAWRRRGTSKRRFAGVMAESNIPCPAGLTIPSGATAPYCLNVFKNLQPGETIIMKPNDGAGCEGVRRYTPTDFISFFQTLSDGKELVPRATRIERFIPGLPASIAMLLGPTGALPLRSCAQSIEWSDAVAETPTYNGGMLTGEFEQEKNFQLRCEALALKVAALMEGEIGYVGLDLVLGNATDGSEDVVIELNPRLTTSYVGLSHATSQNLAEAMLQHAQGERVSLSWDNLPVTFAADGEILPSATPE